MLYRYRAAYASLHSRNVTEECEIPSQTLETQVEVRCRTLSSSSHPLNAKSMHAQPRGPSNPSNPGCS